MWDLGRYDPVSARRRGSGAALIGWVVDAIVFNWTLAVLVPLLMVGNSLCSNSNPRLR